MNKFVESIINKEEEQSNRNLPSPGQFQRNQTSRNEGINFVCSGMEWLCGDGPLAYNPLIHKVKLRK